MLLNTREGRFNRVAAAAIGVVGLCVLAVPLTPAQAQMPYLGVDFGGGFGVGIGVPPSAYRIAPASPVLAPYYVPPARYYYYPW